MRLSLPRLRMPRLPGFGILVWVFTALKGWVMASRDKDDDSLIMYDRTLLWLTFGLAAIGFIMVTSASMPVGQRLANDPFLFAKRDALYILLAFCLAMITLRLPMEFWQKIHLNRQQGETWLRVKGEKVLNVKEMKLSGQHNYTNALAALALADAAGLPRASSLKALTTFTGLAHRFQLALEHNGVRWINDSKATNVGSTEAALNGLHVDGTLHLLLGGDGKSADFSSLTRYLGGDRVRLYCFGRDGAQLAALRPEIAEQTETMEEAMRLLAPRLQPGDMVLLSPACASLDQFKNFEQRGDVFTRLAKELG